MSDKWQHRELERKWSLFGDQWEDRWESDSGHKVTGYGSTPEEARRDALQKIERHQYDDSLCLLTTACVRWAALPPDCRELARIRQLRDRYIRGLPQGESLIAIYYALAPLLIRRIELHPEGDSIWARLLQVIRQVADLVEAGRWEQAGAVGWSAFRALSRELLEVDPGPAMAFHEEVSNPTEDPGHQ